MPILSAMAKPIIVAGAGLVAIGLLLLLLGRGGGRLLPGDMIIERPGFTLYFPLATAVVLSIIISLIALLVGWARR